MRVKVRHVLHTFYAESWNVLEKLMVATHWMRRGAALYPSEQPSGKSRTNNHEAVLTKRVELAECTERARIVKLYFRGPVNLHKGSAIHICSPSSPISVASQTTVPSVRPSNSQSQTIQYTWNHSSHVHLC
jgi:hypothetical protein